MKKKQLKLILLVSVFIFMLISVKSINSNFNATSLDNIEIKRSDSPKITSIGNLTITNVGTSDVLLHEAYTNDTLSYLSTNPNNQSISLFSPDSDTFNLSRANITVNNIYTNNFTHNYDDLTHTIGGAATDWSTPLSPLFGSFTIPISCNVTGISLWGAGNTANIYTFYIYNASWDGNKHIPGSNYDAWIKALPRTFKPTVITATNYTLDVQNTFLNNSETVNNTWFISCFVYLGGSFANLKWGYSSVNSPSTDTYKWVTDHYEAKTYDLAFNITLGSHLTTPSPQSINLTINSTEFLDSYNGGGHCIVIKNITRSTQLNYSFSTVWTDATWEVSKIIQNFTGTVVSEINFTAASNQDIYWNVTTNISHFNSSFNNYSISYVLPNYWNLSEVYKDSNLQSIGSIEDIYYDLNRTIIIPSNLAVDGMWILICNSTNIIQNIKTQVGWIDRQWASWNELLNISAICSKSIKQNVNLTIYNETLETILTTSTPIADLTEFQILNWDISNNINFYGDIILRAYWYNSTDAFLCEKNITIVASTNYIFTQAQDYSEHCATKFNVSYVWNDVFLNSNYTTATAGYNLTYPNSSVTFGLASFDPIYQVYNITFDPISLPTGDYILNLNMSLPMTDNATKIFHFSVVTNTQIKLISMNTNVIRGNNATYTFQYWNVSTSSGIPNAITRNISVSPSIFVPWSVVEIATGNYSISINTSNIDAGIYNCQFNISKIEHLSQNLPFLLTITISPSQISIIEYNRTLNRRDSNNLTIKVYFEDITVNQPILNNPSNNFRLLKEDNTVWSPSGTQWWIEELDAGYYKMDVNLNGIDSGNYTLKVESQYLPNHLIIVSSTFNFTLLGNWTAVNPVSLKDSGNNLLSLSNGNYLIFIDNILTMSCNFTDVNYGNIRIPYDASSTKIGINIDGIFLTLLNSQAFTVFQNVYTFSINLTGITLGDHNIEVIFSQRNYENGSLTFQMTVKTKLVISIELVEIGQILIGSPFVIRFRVQFTDESGQLSTLVGRSITLSADQITAFQPISSQTDSEGIVSFTITILSGFPANTPIKFIAKFNGEYNLQSVDFVTDEYIVQESFFLIYLLLGLGVVLGAVVVIPIINRKVIQPRKHCRERCRKEKTESACRSCRKSFLLFD